MDYTIINYYYLLDEPYLAVGILAQNSLTSVFKLGPVRNAPFRRNRAEVHRNQNLNIVQERFHRKMHDQKKKAYSKQTLMQYIAQMIFFHTKLSMDKKNLYLS